jgi:lipopolysaccharide/colanic/teichoic acid biosynthesis glycosyltransferase
MSLSPTIHSSGLESHGGAIIASSPFVESLPATPRTWAYSVQRAGKRLVDVTGAGLGLLLLLPLLVAVAVAIRFGSPGPILFRQIRQGKGGKSFQIYKFRTMIVDAEGHLERIEHLNESAGGVLFKIRRDPRVTRVGRILRRTNIDELPQLFNILRGDMSLVGPRPLQLRDCALLAQTDPEAYQRRQVVIPGLTGLWQASDRSESNSAHMVRLDLEYIDRWSLWLDLRLILQTAFGIIAGRGAC